MMETIDLPKYSERILALVHGDGIISVQGYLQF